MCFILLVITVIMIPLQISGKNKETSEPSDSLLLGSFKLISDLESNDEYNNVLRAMGYRKKYREQFKTCDNLLMEISRDGQGPNATYTFQTIYCDCFEMKGHNFKPGKAFKINLCDDRTAKIVVKVSEKKRKMKRVLSFEEGFKGVQKFTFTEKGMRLLYKVKGSKVMLRFERFDGFFANTNYPMDRDEFPM